MNVTYNQRRVVGTRDHDGVTHFLKRNSGQNYVYNFAFPKWMIIEVLLMCREDPPMPSDKRTCLFLLYDRGSEDDTISGHPLINVMVISLFL
jgi:hypothetical protein